MGIFLALAIVLWGIGWVMGVPLRTRWLSIAIVYLSVLLALVVLPEGAGLRMALGGSVKPWLVGGGIVALGVAYVSLVAYLKHRAPRAKGTRTRNGGFSDSELDRYARHIVLREVGGSGQRKLHKAKVLLVGAGGLGSPAIQYLTAAGVGTIGVIDDDEVELANLQRQVIHSEDTLGMPKVFSAQQFAVRLNPHVTILPYHRRLTEDIAADLVRDFDLVLDGSDNFDTRYMVNRVCATEGKPLISGAIAQWEGQVSLYDATAAHGCFQCTFPEAPAAGSVPTCSEAGVVGPLPGVIGTIMALEAIKHITGAGRTLAGQLLIFDGLYGETRKVALHPREDCPICGNAAKGLEAGAPQA
ncbi:HesA/MoeB/ThiF family protein [Qingshengfaniella alkalisoli]|uniref:Molybdopterin-synthase adenylyltransferase n=1 Tax=Qingshengfaniella alkalisoli TaxID=2599296 RepID=A0A5B8IW01_9RHOB|nr:molybdopterin-synthase adenylyltransferase MoeB [Qingshengfaniella alkalisoli]QDY69663.1 molybdopterin-synthase adenylyltransferase MoeB [Qingshengfaniella alkalisoli]